MRLKKRSAVGSGEHAAELAEHYAYSSNPTELARAVAYGELAAQRAVAVYAYGEAERQLDRALQVQEILNPDDVTRRCDLLLQLGAAILPTEEPERATRTCQPGVELAEAAQDSTRAARAALLALEGLWRASGGPRRDQHTRSHRVGGTRRPIRSRRYGRSGLCGYVEGLYDIAGGRITRGRRLLRGALERARVLGDDEVYRTAAHLGCPCFSHCAIGLWSSSWHARPMRVGARYRGSVPRMCSASTSPASSLSAATGRRPTRSGARCGSLRSQQLMPRWWHQRGSPPACSPSLTADWRTPLPRQHSRAIQIRRGCLTRVPMARLLIARALHYLGRGAEVDLAFFSRPNRFIQANRATVLATVGAVR